MAIDVRGLAPLLEVFGMPTSLKFYCEALGFEGCFEEIRTRNQKAL